jgi:hypothetical protein
MRDTKISLNEIKSLPPGFFLRLIKKMKKNLKNNEILQKIFKDYNLDIEELEYVPMMFSNLEVSAKCDHGIIYFNYKLLCDGDFEKDYSYALHELTHFCQQTTGKKATQSSDDGSYLDNKYEQEGFQNQVEYIADQFGEDEAEQYVDDLLEHHEVENPKEVKEKKEIFLSKV